MSWLESGWWSIVPPVVAIVLAILTRRVVPSLFLGVVMGVLILEGRSDAPSLWHGLSELGETHLWAALGDEDHLRVFAFTLLMGGMIGVIHRAGGMHGVVEAMAPLAKSRRGGQVLTWALGLIVFIDDYANTLLLGNTMRPLADRLRISREKLAYLVDSTAAPVSGLAIVSTWVAGEIGYIQDGYQAVGQADKIEGFSVFVSTIPYRFYVLWALLMVLAVGWLRRDFGPMRTAELRAMEGRPPEWLAEQTRQEQTPDAKPGVRHHWLNAVLPVVVTVAVTIWLLMETGKASLREADTDLATASLMQIVGDGNSYIALLYGALAGLLSVSVMVWSQGILTWVEIRQSAFHGAKLVLPALTILWLAWTLSAITGGDHLGTGAFLGEQLKESISAPWMPTMVFLLSSVVAFATGTSWGTMGILMPIVVPATYTLLGDDPNAIDPNHSILIASIGGVLAGAIFGDHCSPISDTTVLSSQSSGCDHIAHVRTQLPYAFFVALISIVCGTIPVGLGMPVAVSLGLGTVALLAGLFVIGRPTREAA